MRFTSIFIIITILFLSGCQFWSNFTTYFNTYYNAERLITESEKEFAYQEENLRVEPRAFAPDYDVLKEDDLSKDNVPPFMTEFIISKTQLQPVRVKLDSVLIKGSKILANKRNSEFVESTLYLMALAYFYRSEWLPSQVKCGELIDVYPTGKMSPDAHLLYSKSLLIQKKFDFGKKMLSRTVDIAWQLERYDILSEAFRLQADLAIYEKDIEGALRPYKQAISQSSDNELRAKWQLDMANILYRLQEYERAAPAFEEVYDKYSPDYVQTFEANLYQAISLAKTKKYEEADEIISMLEEDGKYSEWVNNSKVARMYLIRSLVKDSVPDVLINSKMLDSTESYSDTALLGNDLYLIYRYERGMDYYFSNDFTKAKSYFDKARNKRTVVFDKANTLNTLLGEIINNKAKMKNFTYGYDTVRYNKSQLSEIAKSAYIVGRNFEKLNRDDSVAFYYNQAINFSSWEDPEMPRYLYAYSDKIRKTDPYSADSLLQVIVDNFPNTEYYVESSKMLGLTEAYLIDTAKEIYSSGDNLRKFKEYNFAVVQYLKVHNEFPKSDYAPKSLYAAGFMFEKDLQNMDSAMKYYRLLMDEYPSSIYAQDIKNSLVYLENKLAGLDIPDSLNLDKRRKTLNKVLTDNDINNMLPKLEGVIIPQDGSIFDPKNLLNKAKGLFKEVIQGTIDSTAKQLEKPKDMFNRAKNFNMDSLKAIKLEDVMNLDSNQRRLLDSLKTPPVLETPKSDTTKLKK